jgi:hypothetical protein
MEVPSSQFFLLVREVVLLLFPWQGATMPELNSDVRVLPTRVDGQPTWGNCGCGGKIVYFSDFGVRCETCNKLYGTWVENLKKAKQEENRKKEHIAQLIQIKRFEDDVLTL